MYVCVVHCPFTAPYSLANLWLPGYMYIVSRAIRIYAHESRRART